MTVVVEKIEIFTRILDGGMAVKCSSCESISRYVPPYPMSCPVCGYELSRHSTMVSEQEYKESRKTVESN